MPLKELNIPEASRGPLIALLNDRLADAIDLALQAKQAHWNVKGPNFIALHELFDKVAEAAQEHADVIAERAVILSGIAEGTIQAVQRRSQLPPYSLTVQDWRAHVEAVANALATFGNAIRDAIDRADELGDADTADLFTGVSRDTDKNHWFVSAHLRGGG
ncbi:MAG: DNA starvation/stationary phase protection protein Dps [Gemmataceae bacterium]